MPGQSEERIHETSRSNPVRIPPREIEQAISVGSGGSQARSGVFICYRRDDEAAFAGRLYDRLVLAFGPDRVFIDVSSVGLGLDFIEVVESSLNTCTVMLVVIGRRWLGGTGPDGGRRIDKTDGTVRLEITRALERRIRVIPILVEGAELPPELELPPPIRALTRRNGRKMSNENFEVEFSQIVSVIQKILD